MVNACLAQPLLLRRQRREYPEKPFHSGADRRPPSCDGAEMNLGRTAMKHRATRELFDYWNGLRGSRLAPERADIDLVAIRGLIANMFMLEVDAEHHFPFVLSGTRVNALGCHEQNGRSFLDLWTPEDARQVGAMLLTVLDAACPIVATAIAQPDGLADHEIEILLLPLGRAGQKRARILGLTAAAAAPSWLGLLPVEALRLVGAEAIEAPRPKPAFDTRAARELAKSQAQPQKTVRNIRHLRVFEGGRQGN